MSPLLKLFIIGSIALLFSYCSSSKKTNTATVKAGNQSEQIVDVSDGPPTLIYKTKKDYRDNVAVTLSDDKSKIVSYPHSKDVYYKGKLAYPTKLNNGYLLDNKGISINVAFLNMTYEKYSQLENIPSLVKLYEMIIDKDPLAELYNCGNRHKFKNEIEELNQLITKHQLEDCKCLKK